MRQGISHTLRRERSLFISASAPRAAATSSVYQLTLRSTHHTADSGSNSGGSGGSQSFLVGQARASGKAAALAASAAEVFAVPLIPWYTPSRLCNPNVGPRCIRCFSNLSISAPSPCLNEGVSLSVSINMLSSKQAI